MADQFDGYDDSDTYQNDGYVEGLDEDIPNSGNDTWESYEPPPSDQPYYEGLEEGIQTGLEAQQYDIGRTIVQGQFDIQQQAADQAQVQQWQQDLAAAEGFLGRELSDGEWRALQADAADPGGHHDVANLLNDYWANTSREEKMLNSLNAMHENAQPDEIEVLPGPAEGYGLPENASRQQLRDARDAWSHQQHLINTGKYGYID